MLYFLLMFFIVACVTLAAALWRCHRFGVMIRKARERADLLNSLESCPLEYWRLTNSQRALLTRWELNSSQQHAIESLINIRVESLEKQLVDTKRFESLEKKLRSKKKR